MAQASGTQDDRSERDIEALFYKLQGAALTQALVATVQLGIADLLGCRPMESNDLAERVQVDAPSLARLLALLESEGFVEKPRPHTFALTPLGRCLTTDDPVSIRPYVLLWGAPWFWETLAALPECIRSGISGVEATRGQRLFDFLDSNPTASKNYDDALACLNEADSLERLVAAYPFEKASLIIDVGGGTGSTIAAVLESAPNARGILFDQPRLRNAAIELLKRKGLLSRCEFVAGDFLNSVPPGGDIYVLKWIIIDWNDSDVSRILSSLQQVMQKSSRLLVVAGLRDEAESPLTRQSDVLGLAIPGGLRRSEAEIVALFSKGGFVHHQTIPIDRHYLLEFQRKVA